MINLTIRQSISSSPRNIKIKRVRPRRCSVKRTRTLFSTPLCGRKVGREGQSRKLSPNATILVSHGELKCK
ncbi:2-C-methyl-D-erythritol 2,4-cyclodiphosphate synthase [Trichinella spiralis]|uniref:2-C-methyl-D-erythritol 2,4-cyclodiphosphate synthase n=1 Tax=Trichinella spiralis TaxID=6334 RepID=A0ABR3K3N6_TRISP